jgi:hypothetical protein
MAKVVGSRHAVPLEEEVVLAFLDQIVRQMQ